MIHHLTLNQQINNHVVLLEYKNLNLRRIKMDKGTNEYDATEPVMGYNGYFFELDEEEDDG